VTQTGDVELHPIAAELAAAMQRSPDKKQIAFPPEVIERARARVRSSNDGDEVLAHLIALAAKIKRLAGDGGTPAIAALVMIVVDKLGSVDEAADRFNAAGITNAAQLLGSIETSRAPREQPKPQATVRPKRGLSK
jgi:hypothetical protein